MKKIIVLAVLILIVLLQAFKSQKTLNPSPDLEGTITLSGAYALYPMAVKWGEEYTKLHPKVKFDTQAGGAGKGMTDAITGTVDIGMVSRDIAPEEIGKGAFGFAVAKDAVIPTINATNPAIKDLLAKGITKEKLTSIFMKASVTTWGQILNNSSNASLNAYIRSDACGAAETFAKYLGGKQEDLEGTAVFGDPGVAEAVTKDINAIGFNNINYVYDVKTRKPHPGLAALPVDFNANGVIDAKENFYATLDQLDEAIVSGAFPSPPARPLYFVTKGKPTKPLVIEFLKWVLTDGQKFVDESGYVKLSDTIIKEELKKLQ